MADGPSSVTRFLHVKFRAPAADMTQLLPLMKAALPMLEALGARVRLMRNADDHSQFVQIIEYQTDPHLEASRQKVASDPKFAASSRARLNFFFERSPYHDQQMNLYPVVRVIAPLNVQLAECK